MKEKQQAQKICLLLKKVMVFAVLFLPIYL